MRKEKRQSSSSFNVSDNREIMKLPPLKGKFGQRYSRISGLVRAFIMSVGIRKVLCYSKNGI